MGVYSEAVLATPGLVRYWRLQETGAASEAVEETGSGDTLAITGATVGLPGGLTNGDGLAYGFDGVNDWLGGGVFPAINALNRPVYEMIFYLASGHNSQVGWFGHGSENQQGHAVCQIFNGSAQFLSRRGSDGAVLQVTFDESQFNLNGWNHILWHAGARRVVINGTKKQAAVGFEGHTTKTGADKLIVGAYQISGSPARHFDGRISEFAIYNGTVSGLNSQTSFDATALAHYQAMHTAYGAAILEIETENTVRGVRRLSSSATLDQSVEISAAGVRVRPPSTYPLRIIVPQSRTKAVLVGESRSRVVLP